MSKVRVLVGTHKKDAFVLMAGGKQQNWEVTAREPLIVLDAIAGG
jgi:hypothetical protein